MSTIAISFRRSLAVSVRHNPLAATGVVLVVVFVIFALFAPWITPQDPAFINLPARLDLPSHAHFFGTDELGRDIFSRIVCGARARIRRSRPCAGSQRSSHHRPSHSA